VSPAIIAPASKIAKMDLMVSAPSAADLKFLHHLPKLVQELQNR
jgi:hypothetical protein